MPWEEGQLQNDVPIELLKRGETNVSHSCTGACVNFDIFLSNYYCMRGRGLARQAMRVAVRRPNCVAALTDELFVAKSVVATVRGARPSLVACAITLWDHSQMMSAQATEGMPKEQTE